MMASVQSRLLAVHVDPIIEDVARRTLEHAGAEMDSASNADQALERLFAHRYGVLVVERDVIEPLLSFIALLVPRPVVIVIGENSESLDPDLITLVVPASYDAHTLVGVILACLNPTRFPLAPHAQEGIGEVC